MYAIIEVGGHQLKVAADQKIKVEKIKAEVGKIIDLDQVLLFVDDNDVKIGKPLVSNVNVKAKVLSHGRGKKIKVFKKKRRKDYKLSRGHRQAFTELSIESISLSRTEKKTSTASKKETVPPKKTSTTTKTTKTAAYRKKTAPAKKSEPASLKKDDGKKKSVSTVKSNKSTAAAVIPRPKTTVKSTDKKKTEKDTKKESE